MLTSTLRRTVLMATTLALAPVVAMTASPAAAAPGPVCDGFDTVLHGQYTLIPLKNQAMLTEERCGYRFRAGQQDSHLEVTEDNGGLLFRDTGTASWRSVGAPCEKVKVAQGVAAWCPVSDGTTVDDPMLVEVWPRLGDDDVDTSSLPARFQVAALLDAGNDTFLGGDGNDFANGAAGRDVVRGGGGDDWLRGGLGPDKVSGGAGSDKIVTQGGADVVDGGAGTDFLYAGGGTDTVTSGDSGYDLVNCGPSSDRVVSDQGDKRRSCERMTAYVPAGTGTGSSTGTGTESSGDISRADWGTGPIAFGDGTTSLAKEAGKTPGVGPSSPYVQQIMIDGVVPLKDQAIVNPVPNGYLYRAGQQDSDLSMSVVDGRLQLLDRGTAEWKYLPPECRALTVSRGVGASCVIPSFFTEAAPMLIEVWPRLGNDVVDSSALSAAFDLSVLGDRGNDTAYLGAGNDFFNGAQDDDTVYGGDGRDWLRTGLGADFIDGQGGGDALLGVDDDDVIYGGAGNDDLAGGPGNDQLHDGDGDDRVSCGDGIDIAWVLRLASALQCETVNLS